MKSAYEIKKDILEKVKDYYTAKKKEQTTHTLKVPYAGKVYDEEELINLVDSSLDFWLTHGRFSEGFEEKLKLFLGVDYCCFVNSGSSANLLAFMALTSPTLGDRRIKRGDEIITTACCFPTTVTPILQYGAVPVFVDVLENGNISPIHMQKALSLFTKAVMFSNTLGVPANMKFIKDFCKQNNLWCIEDNCDSLGSKYNGRYTGTFGDISTSSFYPAHHITCGEGGAVFTDDPLLHKIMLSMRDWGRDCTCSPGQDNKCGKRFNKKFKNLPYGTDHKYVYSELGYNLKATEMQASIGCAQLEKLIQFNEKRKENYKKLYKGLSHLKNYIILPEKDSFSDPAWFSFFMLLKNDKLFNRNDITQYFENNGIQTRVLFAGNIIRHPLFDTLKEGVDYRVSGSLVNTNKIMKNGFMVGLYQGLNDEHIQHIIETMNKFFKERVIG